MKNEIKKSLEPSRPESVIDLLERYGMGLIESVELFQSLSELEFLTKGGISNGHQVHFICSNGIYFAIQSGICHQLIFSCEVKKMGAI